MEGNGMVGVVVVWCCSCGKGCSEVFFGRAVRSFVRSFVDDKNSTLGFSCVHCSDRS